MTETIQRPRALATEAPAGGGEPSERAPGGGWRAWVVVLGLAALARLALVAVTARYQSPWPWEVEVMSRALVQQGVLGFDWFGRTPIQPSAFLPPVYPLLVAAAMWLGGSQYALALHLAQLVLSVVAVAVVVLLAREMTGSRRVSWIAGLFAAVYPTFVVATVQVNTVTLEVLEIELFGLCLLRWWRRRANGWLAAAGLWLGLLAETRGPAALLWPVVAAWLLLVVPWGARRWRLVGVLAFTLGMLAPVVPWAARNYAVFGELVPIATNAGYNLWVGHNASADGEFDASYDANQPIIDRLAPLGEPERDRYYTRAALEYLTTHPLDEVRLSARKLWFFVWFRPSLGSSYPNGGLLRDAGELGLMAGYGVVVPLALVGMWRTRREWRRLFVVYGVWIAYAVSAVAFFAATRYRAPVEPFLIVFAAAAVAGWLPAARRQGFVLR